MSRMSKPRELAARLREMARTEAANQHGGIERFKVKDTDPFVIEAVDGDVVLEEGDEDFEVSRTVRRFLQDEDEPLERGDTVYVHFDGDSWVAVDAAEGGG